jgi:hypothetical protein
VTATKENVKPSSNQTRGLLTRPALPSKDYEALLVEEDTYQPSEKIYDYSYIDAWYVKKNNYQS